MTEESLWGDEKEWKGHCILLSGKGKLRKSGWLIWASLSPRSLTHLAQSLVKLIWWVTSQWLENTWTDFVKLEPQTMWVKKQKYAFSLENSICTKIAEVSCFKISDLIFLINTVNYFLFILAPRYIFLPVFLLSTSLIGCCLNFYCFAFFFFFWFRVYLIYK